MVSDRPSGGQLRPVCFTLVVVFAAVLAVVFAGGPAAAAGTTVVVDQSGGGDYETIQAAINASADGDRIEVTPGVYRESVTVSTEVTLVAPNGATLNGSSFGETSTGITVDRTLGSGLTIDGFTVERYGDGISVGASAGEDGYNEYQEDEVAGGWTIQNVVVRANAEDGVDVGPTVGSAWTLRNVTAADNGDDGIEAGGFNGDVAWRIVESNASLNRNIGIYVGASSGDWKILDSTTNENFDGLGMGVYIVSRDSAWTIGNHTATDNSFYGIDVVGSSSETWTIHNSTLSDNSRSGLNANDITGDWIVRDTNLSGNYDWGLRAGLAPDDFRIQNVTVVGNSLGGIMVDYTDGNWRIDDSRIENNGGWRFGSRGISANITLGSWAINNTTIAGNLNSGINAEEGQDGRPVGDATDNWWGQPGGPIDNQCVGNVDCGSPLSTEPGTNAPQKQATVAGTVTNGSGDPLDGIEVDVHRDDGSGVFLLEETVTTNATGQYNASVDAPASETTARLTLRFNDSTGTYATEWYDDRPDEASADALDVAVGASATADADLRENTATVYGRVRTESGDPIDGILVIPYREDAGGEFRQLPGIGTNATGQYSYAVDVPAGQSGATVKLLFADPDDDYASRYYDDATALANAIEVYVPAGERVLVSQALPREDDVTAGFSGTVTDGSGTGLSDIDVTVFRDDGTGRFREWTTEPTDANGVFDIDVRPPDPDNALVRAKLRFRDPAGQYTELWYEGASESNADVAAGLVSAELGDLNATLVDDAPPTSDIARVSGWVTNESGAPLDGLLVVPYATDDTGTFRQLPGVGTDANGRYSAEVDMPAGQSAADVKVLFADPDDVYASRYYDDALTLTDATAVTVPGGETRFVSETLPREDDVTAGFAGTVTNESGDPLAGIEVTAFRDDGTGTYQEWTTESTDSQGRYDIDVRPANPGDRRVSVKLRFTDPTWQYAQEWNSTSYRNVRTMADAAEVGSVVGGTQYRDEVLERNVVTVSGVVRNESGGYLEDVLVVTSRKEADGSFEQYGSAATYTDEFGRYETEVPVRDGETTIDLKVGFVDPDDEYARTYWRDARSVRNADVIDAEAGWTLPNVRATMPRLDDVAVTYLGTVYDENNEILEDIRVTIFRDDGTGTFSEWTNVRTDENGYWETDVYPPAGESHVAAKIRYRDEDGSYIEEWEFNETSEASAEVKNGSVGDAFLLYGTRLATAPVTQVSGVVREDTWGGGPLEGIRVTVYRDDGMGGFEPFATTTTDAFGYYEFQVPPPPGSATVSTKLYFTDPAGEYASMWYRDGRRYVESKRMDTPAGEGNYFNDQWLPEAGMLLDVSVQALSTCSTPGDESSCTFPNDADTVTVGPDEAVAVRYELWNGDDEAYTDYDVDDPATGTTMFGANQQIATLTTRTATATLTSPVVDGSYDYRANATSVSASGHVSNSTAWYTIKVEGSVVQRARVGDRFDAAVSNAGSGTPVLVDDGERGLVNTSNTTFESLRLTTTGGDFTLNLTGSDAPPDGMLGLPIAADGTALGYVSVEHSVSDENVDEVVFRFRVSRARLASAGVSPGGVTLYRYVDGTPSPLPTSPVRTTPTQHVFEATSPGLSVFAIGINDRPADAAERDPPSDGERESTSASSTSAASTTEATDTAPAGNDTNNTSPTTTSTTTESTTATTQSSTALPVSIGGRPGLLILSGGLALLVLGVLGRLYRRR